jgi:hypothetical protein
VRLPRSLAFVVLAVVAGGLASSASAGSVAVRDQPAAISCPAAPSGWTAAQQNPVIWGPAQNPGQDDEKVTCTYSQGAKLENVISMFALPVDPNPFNDFDYGCSNPLSQTWSSTGRIYIVSSKTSWAYAELDDASNQLSDSDVPSFEAVTRELLTSSAPSGHTCKITTTQTSAISSFYFSFEFAELGKGTTIYGGVSSSIPSNPETPAGSFLVATKATGSSTLEKVVSVHVPLIPMTVVQNGKKRTIVLKITKGLNFYLEQPTERLRANLVVSKSDVPACKQGSKGTLTLTTKQIFAREVGPTTIRLDVCGKYFSTGEREMQGKIING